MPEFEELVPNSDQSSIILFDFMNLDIPVGVLVPGEVSERFSSERDVVIFEVASDV